jgi:hypothetical protein
MSLIIDQSISQNAEAIKNVFCGKAPMGSSLNDATEGSQGLCDDITRVKFGEIVPRNSGIQLCTKSKKFEVFT